MEPTPRAPNGTVVWLTGRPSSGKSTLAGAIRNELSRAGYASAVLDGDGIRSAIVPPHGYDDEGRAAFYETLARLAALLSKQGLVVLVAATAHRAAYRSAARARAGRFIEVYVDTPLDECARRDEKGLYALARSGQIHGLPTDDFDAPLDPDVVAHGGHDAAAVARLLELLPKAAW